MKTFYVGFSGNKKIGSRILKRYMGTNYSHTFVEYKTAAHMGDDSIYHSAMGSGVGFYANERFEEINTKVSLYEISLDDELYVAIRKVLFKECGRKYAYLQNIGILIGEFLKGLGISFDNPFRDGLNCSELIFLALEMIHPELNEKYDRNTIRPDHIQNILEFYGYKRVL